MATFDPQQHKNAGDDEGVPSGDYLLSLKSFKRQTSKKGKPYLRCLYEVIAGPAKGRKFFDSLSIDLGNTGAMFRLAMLAEQINSGSFDLDSDDDIRQALCRKPFKARVSREINGQYTNNGIARYLNKEITESDRRVMDTWTVDDAERQQYGGDQEQFDEDGLPYDDAPHSAASQGRNDDIPF